MSSQTVSAGSKRTAPADPDCSQGSTTPAGKSSWPLSRPTCSYLVRSFTYTSIDPREPEHLTTAQLCSTEPSPKRHKLQTSERDLSYSDNDPLFKQSQIQSRLEKCNAAWDGVENSKNECKKLNANMHTAADTIESNREKYDKVSEDMDQASDALNNSEEKYEKLREDLYKAKDTLNNNYKEYEMLREDLYKAVLTAVDQTVKNAEDDMAEMQGSLKTAVQLSKVYLDEETEERIENLSRSVKNFQNNLQVFRKRHLKEIEESVRNMDELREKASFKLSGERCEEHTDRDEVEG
jgi:uncharacterized phage infection (PIP) family protein YhgE